MRAGSSVPSIYIDTNVLIYAFEGGHPSSASLRPLFRQIEDDELTASTSELTLAEVLVRPYAKGATSLIALFESILSGRDKIHVLPVDREILRASARLRGESRPLKLADSIHVATAIAVGVELFLSNDARLLRLLPPGISGVSPDQLPFEL
jgi:predicted nucleic acid-binding protein